MLNTSIWAKCLLPSGTVWKAWLLPVLLCMAVTGWAQKTKVSGKVYDAETEEPLPFVNISFKGSKIGTTTDINGLYSIETYYATDSLSASFIGYLQLNKKVKKDKSQIIDFPLNPGSVQLDEVVIKYKKTENPAHPIMRSVIEHKNINNREKLDAYEYEVYNKIEFDLNNINDELKNKRVMRPFQFIFDQVDTSDMKTSLPLFITESISEYYYQRKPKSEKEIIKATKVSGIENESISQFLGDMYQNVNIYNNYIEAFGKSFVSPISDYGFFSYKYYLTDSAYIDNNWCYKIRFIPRRKHELAFDGEIWVNDTTYAIKQVDAGISGDANINFIHEFSVAQKYQQVEKEVWLLVKDQLLVDFAISNKAMGFYGRKTTTYRNFHINQPREQEFYSGMDNIIVEDSAMKRNSDFWEQGRHEELSDKEKQIYKMVDTIRTIPQFRTYVDVITLIVSGYKSIGMFDLGPYFTTYSFNRVEGHRLRVGGRTNNNLSKRFEVEGYGAYGLWDDNFKYGFGFRYLLSQQPRQMMGASYKNDVEQLGQGPNAWRQDNILASVFRRNPLIILNKYNELKGFYEREWFYGFSNRLIFSHRKIWPLGLLEFNYAADGAGQKPDITTSEISLYTRFAYKEKFIIGELNRVSLGTEYPVIQTMFNKGIKGVLGSEYSYDKLMINISHGLRINPIGITRYTIEAGKIFGKLPFPLLELHNGNETYSFDNSAFNLMNYYEFVSDEYLSLGLTHHFHGLLLNKIPFIRKLKWRELVSGRAVLGNLSSQNREILLLPNYLRALNQPYYEAGIGIENILKILRIDALWRLTYVDGEYIREYEANHVANISKFGIRATLQVEF